MATEIVQASTRIPYVVINRKLETDKASYINAELTQVATYYNIYRKGMDVITEGSKGDYTPADLRFKLTSRLINKQARFLYGNKPDFVLSHLGDVSKISETNKRDLQTAQSYINKVLDANSIEDSLIKAARDCFIGKRVAFVVNFNESLGVSIAWLNSMQFYYETFPESPDTLKRFIGWTIVDDSSNYANRRIWEKEYIAEDGKVYLNEGMLDGSGNQVGEYREMAEIPLSQIPARVILNDGLSGELNGISDVNEINDYEQYYSKLSNGDIDAERRGMNPIKYAIDMEPSTTKGLSSAPGSFWDLASDTNNGENSKGTVGSLETTLAYSQALKTTLDRIKASAYEQLDMPDVSLESMTGVVTSGKALKSIYWPLIVRCREKFKTWEPNLRKLIDILLEGAINMPKTVSKYTVEAIRPVLYSVDVVNTFPLPEDEEVEKASDMNEVVGQTMSKKAYMKKWRDLTDAEVVEELEQMVIERQMLEESYAAGHMPPEEGKEEEGNIPPVPPIDEGEEI